MPALGKLVDQIRDQRDSEKPGEWYDDGMGRARDLAGGLAEPHLRTGALRALDRVEAAKPALLVLVRGAAGAVLTKLAVGAEEQARLDYLAQDATYAEIRAARRAASDAARGERAALEAARAEAWDELRAIGQEALRVALPFILAAL